MDMSTKNKIVIVCHPGLVEGWQSHFDKLSETMKKRIKSFGEIKW